MPFVYNQISIPNLNSMDNKLDLECNNPGTRFTLNKCFRLSLYTLVVICLISASCTWPVFVKNHVPATNETSTDISIPFPVKDLSINDELSKRLANEWKLALGAAGTVGFGLLAGGFFWGPLTIGIGLWADYIAGSMLSAGAAGGLAYGSGAWHWNGPGGRDGKRDLMLPGGSNWDLDDQGRRFHVAFPHIAFDDSNPSIDGHLMDLFGTHGLSKGQIISASYLQLNDSSSTNSSTSSTGSVFKREGLASKEATTKTVDTYSFVYNHTEGLISVMVPVEAASEAIGALGDYVNGVPRLAKRDSSTWVSFSTYGENDDIMGDVMRKQVPYGDGFENTFKDWFGSQLQPCDFIQCWAGASKGCVAMSEDQNRGENSGIVGEFYTSSYGGIDNECQSG